MKAALPARTAVLVASRRSMWRRLAVVVALACWSTGGFFGMLPGAIGTAQAQPAPAQDPKKLAEAKQHMEAGAAFYNDPSGHKCEEALREFSKAYDLSGSKKALRAMGVCALELERDGDAITYYDKFIEGKDIDAADRAQVESDLKALKAAVARVTFRTDRPNTHVTATRTPSQGLPVTNRYLVTLEGLTVGIHPGAYTFTATAEGSKDLTWQAEIPNGANLNKLLEFQKGAPVTSEGDMTPPAPVTAPAEDKTSRPVPVTAWIFGGLTVASGAVAIGVGVSALSAKSNYDEKNGHSTKKELDSLRSGVTTKNAVTDVFIGLTAASAILTTVFILTRPTVHSKADQARRSFHVLPTAGPSGGGAFAVGSF